MDRVIFRHRVTGRMLVYVAAVIAVAGALVLYIDEGKSVIPIIGITLGAMALPAIVFWLLLQLSGRNLIAELILRDSALRIEMVHIFGKGRKFQIPPPSASDWSWYSRQAQSSTGSRSGVIKMMSDGKTYEMVLDGATVVDEVELRKLAPALVDEMFAAKLLTHKPMLPLNA